MRNMFLFHVALLAILIVSPTSAAEPKADNNDKGKEKAETAGDAKGKAKEESKEPEKPVLTADKETIAALKKLGWTEMTGTWKLLPKTQNRFQVTDGKLSHESSDGLTGVQVYGGKAQVNLLFRSGKRQEGNLDLTRRDENGRIIDAGTLSGEDWYGRGFGIELRRTRARIYGATGRVATDSTMAMDPVLTRTEMSKNKRGLHMLTVSLVKNLLQIYLNGRRIVKSNYKLREEGPIILEVVGEAVVDLMPLRTPQKK